jgi:hypothetical protein
MGCVGLWVGMSWVDVVEEASTPDTGRLLNWA